MSASRLSSTRIAWVLMALAVASQIPATAWAQPPRSIITETLDQNGDGVIDANEMENATQSLLKLDTDKDGTLSPNELRPRQGQRQGQRPAMNNNRAGNNAATTRLKRPIPEPSAEARAPQPPSGVRQIKGRWYIKEAEGKPAVYYYRDGEQFLDLFSDQMGDSNKDGTPDLQVSHDEQFLLIRSQNLPNHPTAKFPNSGNPNTIIPQRFQFRLPLVPEPADTITEVPGGPIGVAINGVVFFNPFEAGGINALEGYSEVWLDSCCGHPQQTGVYHYHKFPVCLKSPFPDDGVNHSPVIGFGFDGYPVYGPYEGNDVLAKDLKGDQALDVCNGHFDPQRGYHYHATLDKFPYMLGGYAGKVEVSNSRALNRAGTGAIQNNAEGTSRIDTAILSAKPGTLERGQTHSIRIELNPAQTRLFPTQAPNRIVIGPYEATNIQRQGNVVEAKLTLPADSPARRVLDCHLEFPSTRALNGTAAIKKNRAFRVIEKANGPTTLPEKKS